MMKRLAAICAVVVVLAAVFVIGIAGCDIGSSDVTIYPANPPVQYEVSE